MGRSLAPDLASVGLLLGVEPGNGLGDVERRLEEFYSRGSLARAHALLQYIVAVHLYRLGYDVQVEYGLPGGLRADVYAEAPWEELVVEVETGRVPPRLMVQYDSYMRARLAYKVLLYSVHAPTALAVPSYLEGFVPWQLMGDGGGRRGLAALIQAYYSIGGERLGRMLDRARLRRVYLISLSVDGIRVEEVEEPPGSARGHEEGLLWI